MQNRTQQAFTVLSTSSTPLVAPKRMKAHEIKPEENSSETDFSFDCNIAEGASWLRFQEV
jgi:hypothetical protein